ncbi:AAA family ATPase [Rhizobium azibense]|uniref:ATPase family protein associated with various cellular activities (AAA) n=1 Tax=Rhizobium azibense TaxID=1136135 RepID=A0A4R3RF84_9HYPH|nr:ATP-binding protein [Rhizobium azibense]TCU32889.1 ATPase family protein associated with various cellular activities (AAA) [Rhizobium azibense]
MTATKHLIAMIRSHASGDGQRFLAIAENIADEAGRAGRAKMAGEIRGAIAKVRENNNRERDVSPVPIVSPRGELAGLVRATYPDTKLSDLVLGSDLGRRVSGVVREHKDQHLLEAKGLSPRRKFLFSGPPGTGKGLTAAAFAGELNLPLFTILLDGVITKFMGETAAKMRLIFDAMKSTRGVYFFDEVDALASRRDADNDIGEARRMLNSFLQFLEDDRSDSVVVAATNHRTLLDPAIFRRFHAAFSYSRPSTEEARKVLSRSLCQFDLRNVGWATLEADVSGLSQADLVAVADDAARDAVLDHDAVISTEILVRALRDRKALHNE